MEDVWNRIETWLRANAPETLRDLRSGATRDDIRAAEAALGVAFPDDMVASYLRHDGQDHIGYALMDHWVGRGARLGGASLSCSSSSTRS